MYKTHLILYFMNRLLRVALFLLFFYTGALSAQTPQQLTDPGYNPGLVEHIVLFRFNATTTPAQRSEVIDSFMALKSKCVRNGAPYIISVENGAINNPAIGAHHDFQLGFVVRFKSEGDRNFYVGKPFITDPQFYDPAHERFKNFVGPFLEPGTCGTNAAYGAFVFDFKDKQLPTDTIPVGDTLTLTTCGRVYKYRPLTSPSGKIWLDRNLGADSVASGVYDNWSFGSLYQWGRGNDGHQCINWRTGQPPTSGTSAVLSATDNPGHGLFINLLDTTKRDWRVTGNDNLWQGVNGINNPCPTGYRLPTKLEWQAELTYISAMNGAWTVLKLPNSMIREFNGNIYQFPTGSSYWSSTPGVSGPRNAATLNPVYGVTTPSTMGIQWRQAGCPVRCIKN
jgi:hypothetical protein